MICKTILILECLIHVSVSALVTTPVNIAVINGDVVRLNCSSNGGTTVSWYNDSCGFIRTGCVLTDKTNSIIYTGYSIGSSFPVPKFSVDNTSRSGSTITRDLIINTTSLTDGGLYVCAETVGQTSYTATSAQLIVLGNATELNTTLSDDGAIASNDTFSVTCRITFSGNWTPSIRFIDETRGRTFTGNSRSTVDNVVYELMLVVNTSFHGSKIRCEVYFDANNKLASTNATNFPSVPVNRSATTPIINVLVAVKNIVVHPIKDVFYPGQQVNCSADGNPTPKYQWTLLVNGTVINGSTLIVTENMVGLNVSFRCTATNYFNSQTHNISTDITFYVAAPPVTTAAEPTRADGSSNTAIIAGVVGGVGGAVILIIIIIVVVVCLRKRVNKTDKPINSKPKRTDDMQLVSGEQERSSNDSTHDNGIPSDVDGYARVSSTGATNKPANGRSPVGQYETVGHDVNENPDASPYAQPNNIAPNTPIVSNNNSDYAEVTTRKGPNAPAVPNPKPKPANSPTALYAPIDHNILTGNKN